MVGEATQHPCGSRAETAGAEQALRRGGRFAPAAIQGDEVEQLGRLEEHLANSFCSMNLVGSKLIEQVPGYTSKSSENGLSSW
ncbi:MAG TPA: hypothetical protein VJP41_11005 [Gaiellaceae bacterium]|nr:hypothetical protein [Gaiellaceae bacterium]